MAHTTVDELLNPPEAKNDSAQARLDHFQCMILTGSRAPLRFAKFIREYVNTAELTDPDNGDPSNPADWTITDQGLPIALLHTIYFAEGMWYMFIENHAPYDAATWPFNKLPASADDGGI